LVREDSVTALDSDAVSSTLKPTSPTNWTR
jgi:hypothetical protein